MNSLINIILTLSTAKILAQIKTNRGLNSLAELCNSFSTYGNMPTDRAKFTAQGPRSKNLPNSSKARKR